MPKLHARSQPTSKHTIKKQPKPTTVVTKKAAKAAPKKKAMTYSDHKAKWVNCEKCNLCATRNKVVFARGSLPCDVLFIVEAPGHSENVLGKPMVGPAGKLIDHIIQVACDKVKTANDEVKWAITNLVSCIPLGDGGNKALEPDEESIEACLPKLYEFIRVAKPQAIVMVGKLAEKHLDPTLITLRGGNAPEANQYVSIDHPAFILRADISFKEILIQRAISTVTDLFLDISLPF